MTPTVNKEERLKELKAQMALIKREMKQLQREIEAESEYVKLNFSGTELMVQKSIAEGVIDGINALQSLAKLKKVSFDIDDSPISYEDTLAINLNADEFSLLIHYDKKSLKIERIRLVKNDFSAITTKTETISSVKYRTGMDVINLLDPIKAAKEELYHIGGRS
jgi:hypothetical protein